MSPTVEKQPVKLHIHAQRFEHGQPVDEEIQHLKGTLYRKGEIYYLKFREQTEDGPIDNTLKIEQDRVTVIRHGAVRMNHEYRLNSTTQGIYHTPYGALNMETHTTAYRFQPLGTTLPLGSENSTNLNHCREDRCGELHWAYHLSLNGNQVGDIRFTVTLKA
ncbi:hypothetical protein GCM10010965_17390 [Caldalkalibacillus thermarum]|uniref:DUF1934 domain-containing protein n=1 Tax=Caldalkalibacillus thermarum TaxID=296745 RepID=UPI00166BA92F|nr:DUF1934 domain-containing protein [Caldalkalibacillus thermarum]GGK25170.1 hypothetical protein GCM10010965_17390 [Caldalkalibacillus thermarum]